MKKLLVMFMAAIAISFASCNSSEQKGDDAATLLETLQSQLADGDGSAIQSTLESAKEKIAELVAKDPEAAKTYVAKVQEFLKENSEKIQEIVGDNTVASGIVSSLVNAPAETIISTLTAGQSVLDNAKDAAQGIQDAIGQAVEDQANAVVDEANKKIDEGKQRAAEKVNEAKEKVNEKVNEAADKLLKDAGLKN